MTDTNSLLDAVDALTKERTEHMAQTDDDGKWLRTHTTQHPPLLTELRNAINPSSNTAAGSSSLASTRNLIDSDAMFEYGKMTGAIGDWCRIYQVRPTKDPIVDLRRWYIAFELNRSDSGWHERELRRWAHVIRNILEPPKKFEVKIACPVCHSWIWINPDGEQIRYPIIVTYRLTIDGTMANEKAHCRASTTDSAGTPIPCGAEWDSFAAIEELGEETEERHAVATIE